MKGSSYRVPFGYCIVVLFLLAFIPTSKTQSSLSEKRILLRLQQQLEYPKTLDSWQNWTDFCFLQPTSFVKVICSNEHITELTIIGNKTSPLFYSPKISPTKNFTISQQTLSQNFSINSLFTLLTKLTKLKKLSLISLGIWGTLPSKIDRFRSLESFNVSSNFIFGEIPKEISYMKNLKSLVLADNLIKGNVPDLRPLKTLLELDLSNNQIGPNFPNLGTNLIDIILKNNSIRSSVPYNLNKFNQLEKFDISSNNFVGPIPRFVFSLPALWYLNLADNKLTGELPEKTQCGKRLYFVDISRNLLNGNLPECIGSDSSKYRIVLSDWNCISGLKFQHPQKFCQRQAIAVNPTAKNRNATAAEKQQISGMKLGFILGIIIGGIILIVGIVCSLIWVTCKRSNSIESAKYDKFDKSVGVKLPAHSLPVIETSKYVARSMRMPSIALPQYHSFTLEELQEATNNFDQINSVTEDSQGKVYRGSLPSGSTVLVKCIKVNEKVSSKSLNRNMEVISQLRNPNLVSVLGHCVETYQDRSKGCTIYIVIEHVGNGSLREHLTDWTRKDRLKWPQRMTISMGIARGVHFLHTGVTPGVYGNGLTMENILMDDSLTPKVGNYRIPLPLKAENLHSQNGSTSENSEKDDIYKVGVIMLELLTGKQITSEHQVDDLKLQLESSLAESPSALQQVIDTAMKGTFAYQSVKTAAEITVNCLCKDLRRRPPMEDVVWHLEYSIQAQQAWTTSGNLALNSGNLGLHM
ncbi:hypothetical protein RND81_07G185900 [Saponaria officinalis]|uniref:Protein kinase domain-containing protein n=1 Tax=Saponaria officinalis TaxID=3572 RepID=A0AAW1JRP8_SAPOF